MAMMWSSPKTSVEVAAGHRTRLLSSEMTMVQVNWATTRMVQKLIYARNPPSK